MSNETAIKLRYRGNIEAHSITKPLSSLLHKSIFHLGQRCSVSIKNENNPSSLKKKNMLDTEHKTHSSLC